MASNHTEHYNLSQWEATDQVLRTDFNADNATIDQVLNHLENDKANLSSHNTMVDILASTNRTLNDLVARVEALEAKS